MPGLEFGIMSCRSTVDICGLSENEAIVETRGSQHKSLEDFHSFTVNIGETYLRTIDPR